MRRRRDLGCTTSVTTAKDGKVVKAKLQLQHTSTRLVLVVAKHWPSVMPCWLSLRVDQKRCQQLWLTNEFVMPTLVLKLASEPALKQAIQRRCRAHRPKDPDTASALLLAASGL